MFIKVQCHI